MSLLVMGGWGGRSQFEIPPQHFRNSDLSRSEKLFRVSKLTSFVSDEVDVF